jgi:hypothetical protein
MNKFELKKALYSVYKKYKSSGFMSDTFIKTIDSFYTQSEPSLFINRIQGYVKSFDEGKGVADYKPFIDECRAILNGEVEAKESVNESSEKPAPKPELKPDKVETKSEKKTEAQPEVKTVEKPKVVKIEKPVVSKPTVVQPKSTKKSKLTSIDLSTKTLKIPIANGLVDLLDENIVNASRDYLLGSGVLNDEEVMILNENKLNTSIMKNHDFTITRSDLFTMLSLLGLSHLNVNVTDNLLNDIFEGNSLKIEFFNWLMNTNLVELDVQTRVRKLQQKFDKNISQNERIETMLGYLLLERANVPKNKNRETIKQFLDTSSIMNQSIDAFGVLDGIISSKVVSIKDYKRARGE